MRWVLGNQIRTMHKTCKAVEGVEETLPTVPRSFNSPCEGILLAAGNTTNTVESYELIWTSSSLLSMLRERLNCIM